MNSLIFCRKTRFQKIFFWMQKYASNANLSAPIPKKNIIQEDLLDACDYRLVDYNASLLEEILLNKLLDERVTKSLGKYYINQQIRDVYGKRIIFETKKILRSFKYAETAAIKSQILSSLYIWPEDFDYSIYKELNKLGKLPKKIKIVKIAILLSVIKGIFKKIYFSAQSFIFLEKSLICKKIPNSHSVEYKYIIHMDEGLKGWNLNSDQFVIDNKSIVKDEVLFINFQKKDKPWVGEYKSNGFAVLDFNKLPSLIDKMGLLKIYLEYFIFRFSILNLIFRKSWSSSELYYLFKENFLWQIFYKRYNIKKAISFMTTRSITESVIHQKMNTETIFVYFSTTENILRDIDSPKVSHCHDYTHMYYDKLVANKISTKWLNTLQNNIKNTSLIGPIFSDSIINSKKIKLDLIKSINIKNYKNIISYIDTPAGLYSVLNIESYKIFIQSLLSLSRKYPENYYLFKSKKSYSDIESLCDDELKALMSKVMSVVNIIYVNNTNLSTYETIGISDFTISGPKSSVIYESFHARQPTICYDTSNSLSKRSLYNKIPKCNAYNEDELFELHDYWEANHMSTDLDAYFSKIDVILDTVSGEATNFQKLRDVIKL